MVVSVRSGQRTGRATRAERVPPAVVWHDLECGSYRADLPLWRELAERAGGPILDVGAGTGRVTLELARAGHALTALERDPLLLGALRERASGLDVQTVHADARSFTLSRRDFSACLVPMQTIQLLGGTVGRRAFMRSARAHLRPGGVLACAVVGALEPFDCSAGQIGPAAERAHVGGLLYVSRATRVSEDASTVTIERERRVIDERPGSPKRHSDTLAPDARRERDLVELDRVAARTLEQEGREGGLEPLAVREIPATDEHVGGVVVVLGA